MLIISILIDNIINILIIDIVKDTKARTIQQVPINIIFLGLSRRISRISLRMKTLFTRSTCMNNDAITVLHYNSTMKTQRLYKDTKGTNCICLNHILLHCNSILNIQKQSKGMGYVWTKFLQN